MNYKSVEINIVRNLSWNVIFRETSRMRGIAIKQRESTLTVDYLFFFSFLVFLFFFFSLIFTIFFRWWLILKEMSQTNLCRLQLYFFDILQKEKHFSLIQSFSLTPLMNDFHLKCLKRKLYFYNNSLLVLLLGLRT